MIELFNSTTVPAPHTEWQEWCNLVLKSAQGDLDTLPIYVMDILIESSLNHCNASTTLGDRIVQYERLSEQHWRIFATSFEDFRHILTILKLAL